MSNDLHKKQRVNVMLTPKEIERAVERAISALSFVSFDECYIFAISRKFGDVGVKIEQTHNISPEGLSLLSQSVQQLVAKSIQTTITYKDGRIEEDGKIVVKEVEGTTGAGECEIPRRSLEVLKKEEDN